MDDRKIELEQYKTSFNLPDVITARTILAYQGGFLQSRNNEMFMVLRWNLINRLGLIENWRSEMWPDLSKDILDSEDPKVANLIIAVVNSVFEKMQELQTTPKN